MLRPAETETELSADAADPDGCSEPSSSPSAPATVVHPVAASIRTKSAYGRAFWLTYLSLSSLMIAVSLMYRYADFISFLGGGEWELGTVVGVGMIGSLLMRLVQGTGIDRFGPRHIWLASAGLFVVSMLGHLLVSRPGGIEIYVLQAMYRTSIAGVFGAAFTFAFQQVPVHRMAEAVGTVGTASFLGMVIGPMIGDAISGGQGRAGTRAELDWLFLVAAGLGCLSLIAAWFATRRESRPPAQHRLPLTILLRRHHPRALLLMAIVMGVALGIPATFLRPFAAELGINRMALFFTFYALTAIATRLATRRAIDQMGTRTSVVVGIAGIAAAMFSYLFVTVEWQLVVPAVLTGAGQAVLYPAVVAGGSAAFPDRYRGLGTTLILAAIDLGTLVGAPLVGGIVDGAKRIGVPGYSSMFLIVAGLLIVAGTAYAVSTQASRSATRDVVG
jgi:MFS family permease